LWTVIGALTYLIYSRGSLDLFEVVEAVAACACIPVAAMSMIGSVFLDTVASAVIIDRLRLITDRVQRSTPTTADFDGLLREIVDAQHLVSRVAAALETPTVLFIIAMVAVAGDCFFLGIGPQPADPEALWYKGPREMIISLGSFYVIFSILSLGQPAKATSACNALGEAINELTTKGAGVPTKEQREVIEHLYGYVRNINRGKRMGFMVHRKRISHSFVMSMLVRAVSSMAFLFPIILSLTRHAKREGELQANATCAC